VGLEPTTLASAGLRSIQLSYRRLVPKVGFEPTCPFGHYALNVARLPFRHFGISGHIIWYWHLGGQRANCTLNQRSSFVSFILPSPLLLGRRAVHRDDGDSDIRGGWIRHAPCCRASHLPSDYVHVVRVRAHSGAPPL
jgi:hypothetical protein